MVVVVFVHKQASELESASPRVNFMIFFWMRILCARGSNARSAPRKDLQSRLF